ncbi:substrate-binding domain-containing protein [Goodfellowiella coeruleoviolacea]|uniref:Extracellular solute-binding protein n=1 Tax=Goodfellowiella coeruleoviolacea TaxID=334858 RepID=A0AAE3GAE3_9PSEU|nr:substrate-binding domain-containing protein [Goodfellowiella coeruleoviolacea]MCP2163830.1 extracellular solute-binding protein [Goodfellowiella coeruleoviolacea]
MGRHRTLRTRVRRGIARWPIVVTGLVAVLLLGWFGWTWLGGQLDRRASAEAGTCAEGQATLRIAVTPSAADAIRDVAQEWSGQRPIVYDHCIRVEVQPIDARTALDALTQGWDEGRLGSRPQAWLPDSTLWTNQLAQRSPAAVGSSARSVATSPVLLAVSEQAAGALRTATPPRWAELPALSSAPDGWARYGQPGWGALRVALPAPPANPASALAVQAVLADANGGQLGPDTVAGQQAGTAISQLASGAAGSPGTVTEALGAVAGNQLPGTGFSAVPALEVDLYRHNTGKDGAGAGAPLTGLALGGATPVADFPYLPLSAQWANEAQARAAQKFREFLDEPAARRILAAAGLRVSGDAAHPTAPGLDWPAQDQPLPPVDAATAEQITGAWAGATQGG